jgi:hypothetical protein
MARIMDDLKIDILRNIDDQMDAAELLPFRYQNKRDFVG